MHKTTNAKKNQFLDSFFKAKRVYFLLCYFSFNFWFAQIYISEGATVHVAENDSFHKLLTNAGEQLQGKVVVISDAEIVALHDQDRFNNKEIQKENIHKNPFNPAVFQKTTKPAKRNNHTASRQSKKKSIVKFAISQDFSQPDNFTKNSKDVSCATTFLQQNFKKISVFSKRTIHFSAFKVKEINPLLYFGSSIFDVYFTSHSVRPPPFSI